MKHIRAILPAALLAAAFCLRAEGGRLNAYDGAGTLIRSYETPVSSLRQADRERVENGLYFGTFPELTQGCEDLTS